MPVEQTRVIKLPGWHEGQKRIQRERKRYSLICAHRGWWKTSFCIRNAFSWLLSGRDMGWWSPTFKHVQNAWIDFRNVVGHDDFFNKSDNTFKLEYEGKQLGTCYFFSLVDPDSARGFTLPGVGDEMGLWPPGAWDSVIKSVVNKYGKDTWFLANGTPNPYDPYNDFYNLVTKAEDYSDLYASWTIPCYGADIVDGVLTPYVDKYTEYHNPNSPFLSFEDCRADYSMSDRKNSWLIEYLCKFIADEGGQFTGVQETCDIPEDSLITNRQGEWFAKGYDKPEGRTNKWIQMGVDIALSPNFTVIIAVDKYTNSMVYMRRFQPQGRQRWELVEQAIVDAYNMFEGCTVNIDGTGAGSRLVETLPRMGVSLNKWGQGTSEMSFSTNKERILDELSSLISKHQIHLFRLRVLIRELERMVRVARASGQFDIRAPKASGDAGNDDIVSALALAFLGVKPLVEGYTTQDMSQFIPQESWWTKEKW